MESVRSYKLTQNKATNAKYNALYSSKDLTKEVGLITGMADIMFYIGEDIKWMNLLGKEINYFGAIAIKIIGDE